jgi:outer membrane protein TolC
VDIPVALPSALVHLRPDIQAAEAILHADTAMVGVATARLYPDVKLVASLSQEGVTPSSLFGFGGTAYSFGPALTLPLFDGGALRAERRVAQAQVRADYAQYRQTVLTAFVQVADVLSALAQDDKRLEQFTRAEDVARRNLDESRGGYDLGGLPLASVVVADRQWRQVRFDRTVAAGQRVADIVDLFAATAADWRTEAPAPAKAGR